jgi:adenylosuccinate lyase
MENLVIHDENMLKNAELYGGIVFSQKVLLKLVDKGFTREQAHKIVQKHALSALNGGNFKEGLMEELLLDADELEECFNKDVYLKNKL